MWPRVVALLACTSALRPHTHAPPRRRAVALRAGAFVPVGAVRAGEVTRVESYGCFVKLDDGGASGLVHASELSRERARAEDVVAVGQPVLVKVLAPREPGRTSFSLKAVDQRTGAASAPPKRARKTAATTKVSLGDCVVSYSRASGAGGQNVNKVSTKAELRISVDDSKLPPAVRAQLRATHAARASRAKEWATAGSARRPRVECRRAAKREASASASSATSENRISRISASATNSARRPPLPRSSRSSRSAFARRPSRRPCVPAARSRGPRRATPRTVSGSPGPRPRSNGPRRRNARALAETSPRR